MIKSILKSISLFIFITILGSSCATLNKHRMLKTPVDYKFSSFPDSVKIEAYRIAPNDNIVLQVYTNNGFKIVNLSQGRDQSANNRVGLTFKVRADGRVKIPVLDEIQIAGLTLLQAEKLLEERFSEYYIDPFVILEVSNKRVFLFKGGGTASVITLDNENTTLFEAIAKSGGLPQGNNASRIKIIRGDLKNPEIYLIDLSTIEGMKDANLVLQANDIIYIDPVINYASTISSDIGSVLTLVSSLFSLFLIYTVASNP